jgi:hypothetical protein
MSLTKVTYSMIDGAAFNVTDYGASPLASASVNTAAIQAAINDAAILGGVVFIPAGTYLCDSTLNMAQKVTLAGEGYKSTILSFNHTGAGIKMVSTINSSVAVNTVVKDLAIACTNLLNTDGGYVDVCGTFVVCQALEIYGFKYGIIFDQTELAEIDLCGLYSAVAGGAAIWIVDGPSYTPGALNGFTNRISITRNQINCAATAYGLADDGGYTHVIATNNFNGCLNHIRLAGGNGISITGNEMESASGSSIENYSTNLIGGAGSVVTSLSLSGNVIVPTVGNNGLKFNFSIAPVTSTGNLYANAGVTPAVAGLNNVFSWNSVGDYFANTPTTGNPTTQFTSYDFGSFTPVLAIGGSTTGITYATQLGRYCRVGGAVNFSIDIALTSKGAATGGVTISGLPYSSIATIIQQINPPFATNINTITSIGAWIEPSDTVIKLQNAVVNFSAALSNAEISDNTILRLTGSYLV